MDIGQILLQAPVFLLIFARCFALFMTLPMFSMRSVPRMAKIALSGYVAFFVLSYAEFSAYSQFFGDEGVFSFNFVLALAGEILIGIIMGFFVTMVFSAFSTAGQFTAFQMGFSAASTYDALAQVENPLLGQFFNFMAILVFLQTKWFQRLFLGGLTASFQTLTVFNIAMHRDALVRFLLGGLTKLFGDALVIALPIMGVLFLISVCTGLLTKAAPQMNLLSEGFPIMILVAFYVIMTVLPSMINFFERSFRSALEELQQLFIQIGGSIG